jgi:hypothetical protein
LDAASRHPHEELLSQDVAYALARAGICRFPGNSDGFFPRDIEPKNIWREHPLNFQGQKIYLDLLLVSKQSNSTLVVVEVKKCADYEPTNDPRKVLGYCEAVAQRYCQWRHVNPLVVAVWYEHDLLAELNRKGVDSFQYSEATNRLVRMEA